MQAGEVVFDKYEIIRTIKESEEVSVYQAKHIYLNSTWIIKKIHHNNPIYTNEIHMLESLNHESIPLITDVFKENDWTYVVREYIEGDTLGEFIRKKGVMSEVMTIDIATQICQALEYLHTDFESPLIYRDIKPDNIVLSKHNRIKLIDFGIARFYQENKDADTEYLGTRGFAAPEQYGMGQTDVRTDIFGVGIVMYFMLTKKNLNSVSSRLEPIRFFRADIREEFEQIIQKACQFNRDQRYESITELKNALQKIREVEAENSLDLLLRSYKDKIISVWGIKAGSGVTHVTSTLAHYLTECKSKCVIVDMSNNQALSSLEYTDETSICDGVLIWNTMPIIDKTVEKSLSKKRLHKLLSACDWIIMDLGSAGNLQAQELCGAYNILVGGIAPWEISQVEDYLMSDIPPRTSFFINHGYDEQVEALNHSINYIYVYKYPYSHIENNQEISYQDFYRALFKDWGMMEKCSNKVKAEAFLDIEKFKTKFLKSIKSLQ